VKYDIIKSIGNLNKGFFMADKLLDARAFLSKLAKSDEIAGISIDDLKSVDALTLAKTLNVNGKDGLTRSDIAAIYEILEPDQRKGATDALVANLNIAFAGTGIVVKEDPQPEKFDIKDFSRFTAFPKYGNEKKIDQFVAFAQTKEFGELDKASFENIHHAYFRAFQKSKVDQESKVVELPKSITDRLTRSQNDSYVMGEDAPFITTRTAGGITTIAGQAYETRDVETLADMARFGSNTAFPKSGNQKKIDAFVELVKDHKLEYLSEPAIKDIHHAYFMVLKDRKVYLPESVTKHLTPDQLSSYNNRQSAAHLSEYSPRQIVGMAGGGGMFSSPVYGGTPNINGHVTRAQPQPLGNSGFSNPAVDREIAGIQETMRRLAGTDGSLSAEDLGKGDRKKAREVMKMLDGNHDGKVEQWEVEKLYPNRESAASLMRLLKHVNDSNANPNNHLPNNGPKGTLHK